MPSAPRRERRWAWDPTFDDEAMAEFERRLGRALPRNQDGYLLAKARALLGTGETRAIPIAMRLLERVIAEWPEPVQLRLGEHMAVPQAHDLLAGIYQGMNDLDRAEHHLRLCIAKADAHRNGVGVMPAVSLAEVLIKKGGKRNLAEAERLLVGVSRQRRGLFWSSEFFGYFVARARLARLQGEDPSTWAEKALETVADTRPQASRHPRVGAVTTDEATLSELRGLAGPRAWSPQLRR